MNFASDNGAGVAAPILEAIARLEPRQRARLRRRRIHRARRGALARNLRAQGVGLSRRHRHRRQRAVARRAGGAVAGGVLPRRSACDRRRMRRAGILHRRGQGRRRPRRRRQDSAGGARRDARALSARPGQDAASPARCRSARRRRRGRPTAPTRSPRWRRSPARRGWACIWTARASPMSWPRPARRRRTLTWRAGVDVLSLGATKNGALACEAVIVFDPDKAAAMPYQRKRAGQTLSKGRFLGAQMEAWLAGDLWLELARRANARRAPPRRRARGRARPAPRLSRRGQRGLRRRARRGAGALARGGGEVPRLVDALGASRSRARDGRDDGAPGDVVRDQRGRSRRAAGARRGAATKPQFPERLRASTARMGSPRR